MSTDVSRLTAQASAAAKASALAEAQLHQVQELLSRAMSSEFPPNAADCARLGTLALQLHERLSKICGEAKKELAVATVRASVARRATEQRD